MIDFNKSDQRFNFILYGTGRTGSNLLKGLINQLDNIICYPEILGKPLLKSQHGLETKEDFKQKKFKNIHDFAEISIDRKDYDNYQYVGMKLHYWHAKRVAKACTDENAVQKHLRENVKIVYNNRTNLVKKTFSRLMAKHKKVFYVRPDQEIIADQIYIPIDEISNTLKADKTARNFLFEQVNPDPKNLCTINYENDLETPEKAQKTLDRLQLFFYPNLKPYPIKITSPTIRTPLRNNWRKHISNFDELNQHFKHNKELRGMLNEV